ncbi:MAG: SOS response-associated peptidase [Hyphomicrobiaceae bacterium]
MSATATRLTSFLMCGRITQKSSPDELGLTIIMGTPDDPRLEKARKRHDGETDWTPRYNGAPGQEHWVIRQNHKTGQRSLDRLWWGLIPYWSKDIGRKPINAKAETVASLPMFRDAYKLRRCILPIDNFFEWRAVKGAKAKQPYAIGMKDGKPFAVAAIWENWKHPGTDDWIRTFAVVTCPANALVAEIHDRMPLILPPTAYDRWLSNMEPDPRDLLVPFDAELMTIWPISTRVNAVANDDADLLTPYDLG